MIAQSGIARLKVVNDLFEIEIARGKGDEINESRLASLYVKILGEKLAEALTALESKDVASILSVAARIDIKIAKKAVARLKTQIKAGK